MEPISVESAAGEGEEEVCANGDCSPSPPTAPKRLVLDLNHSHNIDDISTPSDLKFGEEFDFEDADNVAKSKEIEKLLEDYESVSVEVWQQLAKSKGGLLSDKYRRKIWPQLVGVTSDEMTEPPSLEELSQHPEYNQVVLDVNRSLKRFPPGIPYARRVALQDQLTVLILRVILAHPHLKYYQGYHDVAITLLLVCGARAAFPLLSRLSSGPTAPLEPFMQPTMRPTQHRLNFLLPALRRVQPRLADALQQAGVGTMFALPWYLTWFGHSLPRYADVVRLYDYFLCSAPLFPVYVTAAIVLHRADEVFECECDMAMLHCLLSRLPSWLPFEELLASAQTLYEAHPPETLEDDVVRLEAMEEAQRRDDEARMQRRARERALERAAQHSRVARLRRAAAALSARLPRRYLLATAAVLLGVYAYYRPELFAR